jgi:PadR family transcriptional regulator PadR
MKYLSRPEEMILLALRRLKHDAYGVSIRNLVQKWTGKYWSIGAVYVPLERLERKGFVTSSSSAPTPERGGRKKRIFTITREGIRELEKIRQVNTAMWDGYPETVWDRD